MTATRSPTAADSMTCKCGTYLAPGNMFVQIAGETYCRNCMPMTPRHTPKGDGDVDWVLEELIALLFAEAKLRHKKLLCPIERTYEHRAATALRALSTRSQTGNLGCADCGRPYSKGPDLVVSDADWAKIAPRPDGGGVLCPNCMNDRFEAIGAREIAAAFTSGPFATRSQTGRDAIIEECAKAVDAHPMCECDCRAAIAEELRALKPPSPIQEDEK